MKKALRRIVSKFSVKSVAPTRRISLKRNPPAEISPAEVAHLEQISRRYEEAERAWLRMTAPPDGDETWNQVEEHLVANTAQDQDRRWKFFSK